MIEVKDRVSTYPGRVKITRDDGSSEYVTWERADEPTEEGTPINKVLFDSKADVLTEDITVYVSYMGDDYTGDGTAVLPYRSIQKAIDSLPKFLGDCTATIDIGTGVYYEVLSLKNFKGGTLKLGQPGRPVNVCGINVSNCDLVISRITQVFFEPGVTTGNLFAIGYCSTVVNEADLTIDGKNASNGYGLTATLGSAFISTANRVTVNFMVKDCIHISGTGRAYFDAINGAENAATGLMVRTGGVITYRTNTLQAVTATSTVNGARIYTGAQNNVPIY